MITSDGFFKTGDIGYYDENKYFYFIGRSKDIIKCEGIVVSPQELENILLTHESVEKAAVIGVRDEDSDEIPMAFVSLNKGMTASEQQLLDYVNEHVNYFKKLRGGVKVLEHLPLLKNGLNKIDKIKLKNIYSG